MFVNIIGEGNKGIEAYLNAKQRWNIQNIHILKFMFNYFSIWQFVFTKYKHKFQYNYNGFPSVLKIGLTIELVRYNS